MNDVRHITEQVLGMRTERSKFKIEKFVFKDKSCTLVNEHEDVNNTTKTIYWENELNLDLD